MKSPLEETVTICTTDEPFVHEVRVARTSPRSKRHVHGHKIRKIMSSLSLRSKQDPTSDRRTLGKTGLLDYLAADARPTFVIDHCTCNQIAFTNDSFRQLKQARLDDGLWRDNALEQWVAELRNFSSGTSVSFGGILWARTGLDGGYEVFSGHIEKQQQSGEKVDLGSREQDAHPRVLDDAGSRDAQSKASRKPLDWTRQVIPDLSEHIVRVKDFAWDKTSLGPMEAWSPTLRQVVTTMMANPDPRVLIWGFDHSMIYNEACAVVFGQKHPAALGARSRDVWNEVWNLFEPIIENAKQEMKATSFPQMPLTMQHHGFDEETHWRVNLVPILEPDGHCTGVIDEFLECTSDVVQNRRREVIVNTSQLVSLADTVDQVWHSFLKGIESATEDVPFAMVYTPTGSTHANPAGVNAPSGPLHHFSLTGAVGISTVAADIPSSIDLQSSDRSTELVEAFRRAHGTGKNVVLEAENGSLPSELAVAIPDRAAGHRVRVAVIVPIPDLFEDHQLAFLVIGMTPRRPFDADAVAFVEYLGDVVAKSACAIFLPEGQRRARQRFEDIEMKLSQQLRTTSLQAERIEARYLRMFHMAPVGMYAITPASRHTIFNETYLNIIGMSQDDAAHGKVEPALWVHEEDLARLMEAWDRCLTDKQPFSIEYRLKKEWRNVDRATGEERVGETWVYAIAGPETDDNGDILQIVGSLLDISDRKYHERVNQIRMNNERAEERFKRLAESAPLGMFLLRPDGSPIYLNDAYFDLLGFSRQEFEDAQARGLGWADQILEDDKERVMEAWMELSDHGVPLNLEYRVVKPWKSWDPATRTEITGSTWLQATAVAERDESGNLIAVQGSVTEISLKKFSERLLAERLEEALATKQQADRFIDMTSHEMRNPLSAILQSADGILSTLFTDQIDGDGVERTLSITGTSYDTVVDSAQTIILCAQHQKRIVDDILTLSKLDSNLLVISPDQACLPELIGKCFRMYEGEIERADIDVSLHVEQGYHDLDISTVMLDSSRVLQVVINLLTNAVKFTRNAEQRSIKVSVDASLTRPSGRHQQISFIEQRPNRPDATEAAEWGTGEEIFLTIAVEDSGRGLSEEELKLLFHRFSQASPKTYKQYGGSGLGLFISRELSELQGGQIGVRSAAGVGSTFMFYIKAKRCDHLVDDFHQGGRSMSQALGSISAPSTRNASHTGSLGSISVPRRASSQVQKHRNSSMQQIRPDVDKLHVLVVEDNVINQRVMATQLRKLGCVVHVANHGLEAIEFLQRTTLWNPTLEKLPDTPMDVAFPQTVPLSIILMDVEMPVLGGLNAVKQVRELEKAGRLKSHVPVIAITANARSEQIAIAIEHGMDSVVTKPFRIPELVPQMERLAARFHSSL